MPWNTTPTPEQRLKFVTLANSGRFTISELCEQFGVSRKCGHKWLVRFAQGGTKALVDGCRAPHSVPLRTGEAMERLIVSAETGSGCKNKQNCCLAAILAQR